MAPLNLFRQEALDHKRDTWLGEILLARPTSFGMLSMLFLAIAFSVLAYLVWGEYTKKARASGYLVPAQGLIKIYPQQPGAVIALRVAEGQLVKKGDLLAIISTERTSMQGPDGQVKLLHLWPPKLLQAGRVNYEAVEGAAAMREAASLSL